MAGIDFKTMINQVDDAGTAYMIMESDFPLEPLNFAQKSIIIQKTPV